MQNTFPTHHDKQKKPCIGIPATFHSAARCLGVCGPGGGSRGGKTPTPPTQHPQQQQPQKKKTPAWRHPPPPHPASCFLCFPGPLMPTGIKPPRQPLYLPQKASLPSYHHRHTYQISMSCHMPNGHSCINMQHWHGSETYE